MEKSRGLSYRNDQLNRLNRFFKVLNYLFMFLALVKVVLAHSKIEIEIWLWLGALFSGYPSLIFHKPTFKNMLDYVIIIYFDLWFNIIFIGKKC